MTNYNENLAHEDLLEMAEFNEANSAILMRERDTACTELMKLKKEVEENMEKKRNTQ